MRLIDADPLYTAITERFDYCEDILEVVEAQPTVTHDPNGGWILCSERMPEEKESAYAKYYGSDKWRAGMFCKCSDFVEVTIQYSDGKRVVERQRTQDGHWTYNLNFLACRPVVIAWKPKAEPYMGDVKDGD